ncbi:Hypothetical protein CpMEX30_1592 [Corynebacterium pseudotuberculosis]|uniref:hypothetical protein n=1 Tax=Corynebacterium pseudotuberculosis TaxID=1719 RepID=UPI0004D8D5BF|nr:hypothetical protein [Corynebacterium pseudotuberculosis]AFB72880.2 hypothetical protein CP316_07870 [Corynebacterium pseudotuberculosis 316]AKN59717.1 hypothetical protein CP31_08095 [Corynebacterium pseudotuberculosis 31]AKS13866.1 Hypothetical protein CpE19_1528 [Corynebacterium pseudotuberculosis]AMN73713.2 hypothetical protein ATN04_04685 [Corynebacterium pseudotuberculosis]APB11364.1 hypothetical protein A4R72_07940 [Corynebacterium pseudotuberculosis]
MDVQINQESLERHCQELKEISLVAGEIRSRLLKANISGAYSPLIGLDQIGANHGIVLKGGVGSASAVLQSLTQQIGWLHDALRASYGALTGQEDYARRGIDIADEGGSVGGEPVCFPMRPEAAYENFSFSHPVVVQPVTMDALVQGLAATQEQEVFFGMQSWSDMSRLSAEVAMRLRKVAAELAGGNKGEVIDRAVERINEVAQTSEIFSGNAKAMAEDVSKLIGIKTMLWLEAATANSGIKAITEPAARVASERAALLHFQQKLQRIVDRSVPDIRNLMGANISTESGGGSAEVGMDDVAGNGRPTTAGLEVTGMNTGSRLGAQGTNFVSPSFDSVNNAQHQLQKVGSDSVETHMAHAAGLSHGALSDPSRFGVAHAIPHGMGHTAQNNGLNALGLPISGMNANKSGASGASRFSMPGKSHIPHGIPHTADSFRQTGTRQQWSGHSMHGEPLGSATRQNQSAGRMMPMMTTPPGASQGDKRGKVKSVTSSVEVDKNIAALIGERSAVVPGVIGSWVRQ